MHLQNQWFITILCPEVVLLVSLVWSLYMNWWNGNDINLNRNIKLDYSDVLNEILKKSHAVNCFKSKTLKMEIGLSQPSTSWTFRLKINEREPLLIDCFLVMLVFPTLLLVSLFFPVLAALSVGRMFVQGAGWRLLQAALLWTHWLCVCCSN